MSDKRKYFTFIALVIALVTLLSLGPAAQAQTTDLIITGVVDGPLSGGLPKAIELYAINDIPDLSSYGVSSANNGGGSTGSPEFTFPAHSVTAGSFIYVATEATGFSSFFGFAPTYTNGAASINGDDAIELFQSGVVVDVFGDVNTDGTGQPWEYLDGWAYRVNGTGPDGDTFVLANWTFSGINALDGETGNATAAVPFPIGSYSSGSGSTGQPLPLSEGFDNCTLAGWAIISVDADAANTWRCSETFSNIDVNGFGDTAPADEWLITPPLNLNAQENDTLNFRSWTRFTDSGIPYPQLQVLYSTDYDGGGDPTSATWTALSGITFSPENSEVWTDSGDVDLSGISGANVYIAFHYQSSGTGGGTASNWRVDGINIFEAEAPMDGWVINEINADPDSTLGDANGDGTAHFSQDEFVEIYNNNGADVDISGWTLADGFGVRHTFPAGTIIPDGCAVVVFGGGTPAGPFGGSLVQTASTGQLGLNNGGDTVALSNGLITQAEQGYGSEGGQNQSLTLDPDITGTPPLVQHTTASLSGGALFSPGALMDGSPFATGCYPPAEVKIHDIQGDGFISPYVGINVIIEGVVVGDFQAIGQFGGFHVQEEDAEVDGDPATSEGIFVFHFSTDVAIGDVVQVTGTVVEFNDITELTNVSNVTIIDNGASVTPTAVTLPLANNNDLEAYEGMLVTFPQPLFISEYFNFDRFGEIVLTLDRQFQPTAVYEPGSAQAIDLALANSLSRITMDDGRSGSNPDPARHPNGDIFDLDNRFRGGDQVQNLTGVMDYAFGSYKVQPTTGADYLPQNPRTEGPDDVGGSLHVASFNVLNYFLTLDYRSGDPLDNMCGPLQNQGCRGADADQPLEFARQRAKIIDALATINADVFGLIEMENTTGVKPLEDIVAGLNDLLGAGTYAFIDTGTIGGDVIKVGIIYKPAAVSTVGDYAVLDDVSFTDPLNTGQERSRPALAQTFIDNSTGGIFTVVVNHLKSKSGSEIDDSPDGVCVDGDPGNDIPDCDQGDGQGYFNATRTAAAQALMDWLATDPTGSGDADVLLVGDLNAYDKEDPIDVVLAGADDAPATADDYTDLLQYLLGEFAYTYVFNGQLGYLDHALANQALLPEVTGVTAWHINADEPDILDYDTSFKRDAQDALYEPNAFRSSDHDPVIVGLDVCDEIAPTIAVTVTPDMLWPPNHKYVTVEATVIAADNFDPNPTVTLLSVTSNEPDNGEDDGNTINDIVILDNTTFDLRAERSGIGNGRIYTITYEVTDACGNSAIGTATVTVPLKR